MSVQVEGKVKTFFSHLFSDTNLKGSMSTDVKIQLSMARKSLLNPGRYSYFHN
jgi:hypothetical protein